MIFFTNRVFYLFRLFPAIGSKLPTNEKGSTALHWAAKNGKFEIYQLVSDDLNAEYKNPKIPTKIGYGSYYDERKGCTPLHIAAMEDNLKLCQYIIQNITIKNPEDDRGITPLHLAAEEGNYEVCNLIMNSVNNKEDINQKDIWGRTPFHRAADIGFEAIEPSRKVQYQKLCELFYQNVKSNSPSDNEGNLPFTPLAFCTLLRCRRSQKEIELKNSEYVSGVSENSENTSEKSNEIESAVQTSESEEPNNVLEELIEDFTDEEIAKIEEDLKEQEGEPSEEKKTKVLYIQSGQNGNFSGKYYF